MRHSFLLSTLSCAAALGCASSASEHVDEPAVVPQSTRIVGVQSSTEMRMNPGLSRGVVIVDGSVANIWRLLEAAYDSVGIPVTSRDPGQGIMGNDSFKVRRRLKNVPLTRYIDCGSTQGGPSAETYDIILAIRTQMQPVDAGMRVTTSLQASGRHPSISGDYVNCASTGRLEARIGELIGGKPPE